MKLGRGRGLFRGGAGEDSVLFLFFFFFLKKVDKKTTKELRLKTWDHIGPRKGNFGV